MNIQKSNAVINDLAMQLLPAIIEGDSDAFKALYDLTSDGIYGYCFKMLKTEDVAQQTLQDIYIDLWNEREKLRAVQYPYSYILRIAGQFTYRHFKDKNNTTAILDNYERSLLVPPEIAERVSEETLEILQLIEVSVQGLSAIEAAIFRYAKYDDLKAEEIAQRVDLPVEKVNQIINRTMEHVRRAVYGG